MDFENYSFKRIKNNFSYNKAKLRILDIARKDNEKMSRDEMIDMCNEYLKQIREKYPDVDGLVSVSIKYSNRWYSGDVSEFKDDINYFTPSDSGLDFEDPDQYERIRFQFIPVRHVRAGGTDDHNDCLMKCIMKYFKNSRKWISPADLKQKLGLERDDKISIDLMGKVEEIINGSDPSPYAIFVSGDAQYDSTIKSQKNIHLILSKGHYSINKTTLMKTTRQSYKERSVLIVDFVNGEYECYDGDENFKMSINDFKDRCNNFFKDDKLLVVNKDFTRESKLMDTIDEAYDYYIKLADELKKESDGLFNMYKCPTIKNMALNHFYDLTKAIQPEEITNNEALWINNSSSHAITYFEHFKGHVDVYDVNSHYPYILQITNNLFPIKNGEYKIIKFINDKPEFGIYHCNITKTELKPYKFFVFNNKNYYTHLDIIMAQSYGLNIELIQDNQPNFLHYSKECLISGSTLFKRYNESLYPLKQKKIKGAKLLLNVLWGALTESKIFKESYELNGNGGDLEGIDIKRLQSDDTHLRIHHQRYTESKFRTNYGRIKPFVLAYGRSKMYFRFKKYEDIIVRMHTDSIYLKEKPNNLSEISDKLGCLKHEYSGHVEINGLNKVLLK